MSVTVRPAGACQRSCWNVSRRGLLSGAAALAFAGASGVRAERPLAIGLTPVFMLSDLRLRADLERYLSDAIGRPVALVTRRTYQEITALLLADQLAAAWICGYPYVQYRDQLELLGIPVWRGRPLYRSYIIVAATGSAHKAADLAGHVHAFSDPDSNSGHLVTQAYLARQGLRAEDFFQKTFYTYSHRNVVRAVASGLADSGSVDGYIWQVMQDVEPALTEATRVVRRSEWMGFPPIAASRSAATRQDVRSITSAFRSMHRSETGERILKQLRLDRFQAPDAHLFDAIAANSRLVRSVGS